MTHIIAPFDTYDAVSLTAIERYQSSSCNDKATLWSPEPVHISFKQYEIQLIKPYSGLFPNGGELIVVGVTTRIGHWFDNAKFDLITLLHLHAEQQQFFKTMNLLTSTGLRDIRLEYGSEPIMRLVGLQGRILDSSEQHHLLK